MSEDADAPKAESLVHLDNDTVKVTEWRFPPGAATGYHRHEMDYVIVPLDSGELRMIDAEGKAGTARLERGKAYFRPAGVEHDVVNANEGAFAFVEVEIKPR